MKTLQRAGGTISDLRQQRYRCGIAMRRLTRFAQHSGQSQRGDTIVEVMVAIVVVSTILVAAYQTTTRNTVTIQDTQEHAAALKYAESQLEILQNATQNGDSFSGLKQCYASDGTESSAAADCQPSIGGAAYTVKLLKPGVAPNPAPESYEALVTWQGLNGDNNNVSLYYRPAAVTP